MPMKGLLSYQDGDLSRLIYILLATIPIFVDEQRKRTIPNVYRHLLQLRKQDSTTAHRYPGNLLRK